jgi:hypothetical protein
VQVRIIRFGYAGLAPRREKEQLSGLHLADAPEFINDESIAFAVRFRSYISGARTRLRIAFFFTGDHAIAQPKCVYMRHLNLLSNSTGITWP